MTEILTLSQSIECTYCTDTATHTVNIVSDDNTDRIPVCKPCGTLIVDMAKPVKTDELPNPPLVVDVDIFKRYDYATV